MKMRDRALTRGRDPSGDAHQHLRPHRHNLLGTAGKRLPGTRSGKPSSFRMSGPLTRSTASQDASESVCLRCTKCPRSAAGIGVDPLVHTMAVKRRVVSFLCQYGEFGYEYVFVRAPQALSRGVPGSAVQLSSVQLLCAVSPKATLVLEALEFAPTLSSENQGSRTDMSARRC